MIEPTESESKSKEECDLQVEQLAQKWKIRTSSFRNLWALASAL
jgi:hypothetical protein